MAGFRSVIVGVTGRAVLGLAAIGLLTFGSSSLHAERLKRPQSNSNIASSAVAKTLHDSGIRNARVSTRVTRLSTTRRGNKVDVRCEVRIVIASRSGQRLGPGQTATVSGRGRITIEARSKRARTHARKACIRDVAVATARRRAAPFLASRRKRH